MAAQFPFLTSYDPPGSGEGSLDPLGLYQIADQLAVHLVPAVRERMQRVRFLTAMAVGAIVTSGLSDDPTSREASPYLVWEWLLVEALVRDTETSSVIWGVPGTLVARRAIEQHGYLDARSYLKTPRIFGFHGVYKRLATHLGLVDVHLGPGPHAEALVDAWARGQGLGDLKGARQLISRWTAAVSRSLAETPPRTKPNWDSSAWHELALAFAPHRCLTREKRCLRDLLFAAGDRQLGALPILWDLQSELRDDDFTEEVLHDRLEERAPSYGALLSAIRRYEEFARGLQDAFDVLRAEAAGPDARGFDVPNIVADGDFARSVSNLHLRFEAASRALAEAAPNGTALQNLLCERFAAFGEPMAAGDCALALCTHHEGVQRSKSADGKRPWFDRLAQQRIYIRHAYRVPRLPIRPGRYVHDYRGWPIRRFFQDLS
ncbi:MAG: hypothetical protein IT305_09685 [Chloroflexi bacterium]|nr:hypothetical protein [Chloroflexota bacterium]